MQELVSLFAFVYGAAIASFLDVVSERAVNHGPLTGRSHCPACGKKLLWWELVPIFSWLWLLGKCSQCRVLIPQRHLFEELGLGLLFGFSAWQIISDSSGAGEFTLLFFVLISFSGLALAFFADFRFYIIPDSAWITAVVGATGPVALRAFDVIEQRLLPPAFSQAGLGILLAVVFLAVFAMVSRGAWMGWGDVKLAVALGALVGYPLILFSLAFSFILGAFVGLALVMLRAKTLKQTIPFGPFLIIPPVVMYFVPEIWLRNLLAFFLFSN